MILRADKPEETPVEVAAAKESAPVEGILAEEPPTEEPPKPTQTFRAQLKRAQDEDGVLCRTHIGGQALIEGIMMRGRYNWAVAVRTPDGSIHLEEHDLASGKDKNSWMYKPVIRGCTAFVESLGLGYKALDISAQYAYDFSEEEEEKAAAPGAEAGVDTEAAIAVTDLTDVVAATVHAGSSVSADAPAPAGAPVPAEAAVPAGTPAPADSASEEAQNKERGNGLSSVETTIAMVLGIALGIALFIVIPAVLTNLIVGDYGDKGTFLWNLIDGLLRVAVFIFYIWLIGRMKDIKRMFSYHGAEHKTIHCYEHGLELTPENARRFPTLHVRCGTAFLITTLLIAILVFTIVPVNLLIQALGITNGALRLTVVILSRLILLPIVAGLAYEVTVKWAGAHPEQTLVKIVLWPGMQMQRLTTNEPDDSMLECAIEAMKLVLEKEKERGAEVQPLVPASESA